MLGQAWCGGLDRTGSEGSSENSTSTFRSASRKYTNPAGSSRWPKLQSVLPAWDAEMGLLAAGPGLAVVDIRRSKLTEGLSLSVILLFQISNIFLFKGF